jgi:hypothetical protein
MATITAQQTVSLAARLAELRDSNHSVADFGRAVLDLALTQATTHGTYADGIITIPITVTIKLNPTERNFDAPLTCAEACAQAGTSPEWCALICNPSPLTESFT